MNRVAIFLVACISASIALADGCYIPEQAFRKVPAIPAQRALVSWKDGTETIIVSSALDSEAQRLGWVIPLPSVPDEIEKTSPGALKTLSFCLQPKITHDPSPGIGVAVIAVFLANLILATLLFRRNRFLELLIVLFILCVLAGLLLPSLGSARGAIATGQQSVQVEKTARVGAYQINALRSRSVKDLNDWLTENGFTSLPTSANPTVSGYIANGWVFATVVLTRAENGANAPHPLKIAFKTKEAVYPLQFTSIAGGKTAFEIFVVADQRASCDLLKMEFCDAFTKTKAGSRGDQEPGESYSGKGTGLEIGHAAICKLMWDGCVLTKLSGGIEASKMTEDIRFRWKPFKTYRENFYTVQGASQTALILFIWIMGGFVFASMIGCRKRLHGARGVLRYLGKIVLPGMAVTALVATCFFAAVPKLRSSGVHVTRRIYQRMAPKYLQIQISMLLADRPDVLQRTEQEIADYLHATLSLDEHKTGALKGYITKRNAVTGDKLEVEDSPGNFTVEKRLTNVLVRTYDLVGRSVIGEYPK